MSASSYGQTETARRVGNGIQIGTIAEADPTTGRARVSIGEITTAPLPMVTQRAGGDRVWWPYENGEQVCVFAPGGNLSAGVIMGAIHSDAHARNGDSADVHRIDYANGDFIEHDRAGGKLTICVAGDLEITAGGNVTISAGAGVTLVAATGVENTSASLTHNGTNVGDSHTHPHGDPAGRTGGPS